MNRVLGTVTAVVFVVLAGVGFVPNSDAHEWELTDVGRDKLGQCESGNNPTVSTNYTRDENSHGTYQFEQPTWRAALKAMTDEGYGNGHNWNQYADYLPSQVPAAVQDHVVTFWFNKYGPQPWSFGGNCGGQAVAAMQADPDDTVTLLPVHTANAPTPTFTG